jgi:hypothetical protein
MTSLVTESFEGTGYENTWTETVGDGVVDEDSTDITPPTGGGSQTLKIQTASPDYDAATRYDTGSGREVSYTRLYIYIGAEGLANGESIRVACATGTDTQTGRRWELILKQIAAKLSFRLWVYDNGAISEKDQSGDIVTATWYKVEIKLDRTGTAWEWKIDGSVEGSGSLTGNLNTAPRYWWCGTTYGDYTMTTYYDLFAIDDSDYPADPSAGIEILRRRRI